MTSPETTCNQRGMRMLWFSAFAGVASAATYLQRYVPGETLVVQFGTPRTATTLQHRIVQHMANMKNKEYGAPAIEMAKSYFEKLPLPTLEPNHVFKTHARADELYEYLDATNATILVFTTAHDEASMVETLEEAATSSGNRLAFVQRLDTVEYTPLFVMRDYARIFNLTEDQLKFAMANIEEWDTWRLCCGHQSALSNRLRLHGCPPLRPWYDPMEAHCERYNLTAIEELYVVSVLSDSPDVNKYDRADAIVARLPLEVRDQIGVGECVKDMEKTLSGLDFNWQVFKTCEDLVFRWAHDDYNDYICRNYPQSHERICLQHQ